MRQVCLTLTITLTLISSKVKKRFPELDHLVEAGLLLESEKEIFDKLDIEYPGDNKYWLPLAWASKLTIKARDEGLIRDNLGVKSILKELTNFRNKCSSLLDHDWISIPLVYTQVKIYITIYIISN